VKRPDKGTDEESKPRQVPEGEQMAHIVGNSSKVCPARTGTGLGARLSTQVNRTKKAWFRSDKGVGVEK